MVGMGSVEPVRGGGLGRGWQALHYAALTGNLAKVRRLVEGGGHDVNARNDRGYTPLMSACIFDHCDIIRYLLGPGGADVHVANDRGVTPLLSAARWGHAAAFTLLLGAGAASDVGVPDYHGLTVLHEAAASGQVTVAALAVAHGAALNARTRAGRTPLQLALERGHVDMVIYLVSEGADVQQPTLDDSGDTLLHLAARAGLAAAAPVLIQHGASPHQRNRAGKRAVEVARDRATAAAIERTPWRVPSLERLCLTAVRLAAARDPAVLVAAATMLPLPLWRAITHDP